MVFREKLGLLCFNLELILNSWFWQWWSFTLGNCIKREVGVKAIQDLGDASLYITISGSNSSLHLEPKKCVEHALSEICSFICWIHLFYSPSLWCKVLHFHGTTDLRTEFLKTMIWSLVGFFNGPAIWGEFRLKHSKLQHRIHKHSL